MTGQFISRIYFNCRQMPTLNMVAADIESAKTNLCIMAGQFAGVRAGTIEDPNGQKHCFLVGFGCVPQYQFTIPKLP